MPKWLKSSLDEYLNWLPYQRATPSLKEALVELSTECSFRKVSETMSKLTAGVLTKSTIHDLLTEVSQKAIESEKETYAACFNEGKLAKVGDKKAEILYVESDGLSACKSITSLSGDCDQVSFMISRRGRRV